MSDNEKITYFEAISICDELISQLERFCEDIRVAGSVRRRREMVGDIEIVILPKLQDAPIVNQLSMLDTLPDAAVEVPVKNLTFTALNEMTSLYGGDWFRLSLYGKKNGQKYKKFEIRGPNRKWIQIDMFFANADNIGLIYLMRTGPWEFSKHMLSGSKDKGALPDGYVCKGGHIYKDDHLIPIPTEKELFDITGYQYLAPMARDKWQHVLLPQSQAQTDKGGGWEAI